jgi:hypothetical protein
MAFSAAKAIKLFISHAREDLNIVDAIAQTLRAAYLNDIEITMMSEFPAGSNWRKTIMTAVRETDIMISVATGRLKPSHSFTGMEIGVFLESRETRPNMRSFDLERRMIPFAVLAKVPDTVDDYQGIDLEAKDIVDIRFNEDNIQDDLAALEKADFVNSHNKVLKFLLDLEQTRVRALKIDTSDFNRTDERRKVLIDLARKLSINLFQIMLGKEKWSFTPKTKLIVHVPPKNKIDEKASVVAQSGLRLLGNCREVFGLDETDEIVINWEAFTSRAEPTIKLQWSRILNQLISATTNSTYLNENSILSFDGRKYYRVFMSKYTEFYGRDSEFEIFIVEILRRKDHGDETSTKLAKALEIALRYRFMFLEDKSDFSPLVFEADDVGEIAHRASDMLDELNFILFTAREYGLRDPKFVLDLLGKDVAKGLGAKRERWEADRNDLFDAASKLILLPRVGAKDKAAFIDSLVRFCEHNRQGSEEYIAAVMARLQAYIGAT